MKRQLAAILSVMLLALAGNASGSASDLTPNNVRTGAFAENVEWVTNLVVAQDGVGGRVVDGYFYANDQNKIMIFDLEDPLNPALVGQVLMPQEWEYSREDLDTNGSIMVVPNTVTASADGQPRVGANALYIIDVEDKTNPQIIGTLPGAAQHTFSCILDCKWAWGSDGNIVDLRKPSEPKLMEERWGDGLPGSNGHDVTEVSHGLVLTQTQPMMLLDVRKDPLHPKLIASGANIDHRFIHSGRWPRGGKDNFLLVGGEKNLTATCAEDPSRGALMTWDARNWRKTGTFQMIDEYYAKNGTYTDGNPPANPGIGGCSSHWIEANPKFRNGGIVAAAFFGHGTRMFRISSKGKISEAGYFIPAAGETGAVYWITNRIMYTLDYNRGIDILRYTGKL